LLSGYRYGSNHFTELAAIKYINNIKCEINICRDYADNISIIHSNICSSAKKIGDLKYCLDELNVKFSFIGLCETWATTYNHDTLNIPGYKYEQCIRLDKKKGGGTNVHLNTIQYKKREDLKLEKKHCESRN